MRAASWLLLLLTTHAQRQQKPQGVQLTSSPYDILGVHRRATVQEIRNAYRAKARETHPDKARPGREVNLGVRRCCGAFTPSTRLVSMREGAGWSFFRFWGCSDTMLRAGRDAR